MTLFIDPRAGSSDLYGHLPASARALCQLPSGDVMYCGYSHIGETLFGIEYKKLGDALQCMQDGRLVTQLARMHDDYDRSYLLIEADIRPNPKNGYLQKRLTKTVGRKPQTYWVDVVFGRRELVTYDGFMAWLWSITHEGGVTLMPLSRSIEESAKLVCTWYRQSQKPWSAHKSLKVFDESHPPRFVIPTPQAAVAAKLADGIGWDKAFAAAEHFGSIRDMVNASETEWRGVPGIDKVIAARVVQTVNQKHTTVTKSPRRYARPSSFAACKPKSQTKRTTTKRRMK